MEHRGSDVPANNLLLRMTSVLKAMLVRLDSWPARVEGREEQAVERVQGSTALHLYERA